MINSSFSDDSSDEDYEPTIKRKKILRKTKSHKSEIANHTTEVEKSVKKPGRRGRPLKSEASVSSDVSRYREMRDKNNEASRKSRLNRKLKERHMEEEANELEERNRRLKAQVQHLDEMVNNMRNNLMQVLLKK